MDYVIWKQSYDERAAQLDGPLNIKMTHEIYEGLPRLMNWPENATFAVATRHKKATKLLDNHATVRFVVISTRAKELLEGESLTKVEYLPVTITDPKGAVTPGYFILHPVEPQDCLDLAASNPKYNTIVPTDIDWLDRLVIDRSRIQPDVRVFRLKHLPKTILVERPLAEKLRASGLSGFEFPELAQYER